MEDKLFPVLLENEPSVVELTKGDYEKRMGIRSKGGEDQKDQSIGHPVGEATEVQTESSLLPGNGTKADIIKVLKERGWKAGELNPKRRDQLIEML